MPDAQGQGELVKAGMTRSAAFALLALFLTVGQASAECAWVLWFYETSDFKSRAAAQTYSVDSAHATREECDQEMHSYFSILTREGYDVKGGFEGSHEVMGVKGTYMVRYLCLPDIVDPRGVKGK